MHLCWVSQNHYHDIFRLFNVDSRKIVEPRDIRWMNKMYREPRVNFGAIMQEETALSAAIQSDPMEPKSFKNKHGFTKIQMNRKDGEMQSSWN